jgi:hypothetical protein
MWTYDWNGRGYMDTLYFRATLVEFGREPFKPPPEGWLHAAALRCLNMLGQHQHEQARAGIDRRPRAGRSMPLVANAVWVELG